MFLITIKNQITYNGFRLNNEGYSSYPNEDEYLLMENIGVFVNDVIYRKIKNNHSDFEEYNGQRVMLILLRH